MAGTKITKAAGLFLDAVGCTPSANVNGADDSFSQIMDRTKQDFCESESDVKDGNKMQAKAPVKVEKSSEKETVIKQPKAKETAAQNTAAADGTLEESGAVEESVREAVLAAVEEVSEMVKEELDLTEEELDSLMETLGLTQLDLLRPETMQQLVVAAAGEGDSLSILTDEGLYQSVQQLTEAVSQTAAGLQEQLELPEGDKALENILKQMETAAEPEPVEAEILTAETVFEKAAFQKPLAAAEPEEEPEAFIAVEKNNTAEKDTVISVQETGKSAAETSDLPEQSSDAAMPDRKETSERPQADAKSSTQQENTSFLHTAAKPGEVLGNEQVVQPETETSYEPADVQRIMSQITERIKVETGTELSEIEMQLQPETLGTLRIHLTSKEGAVTAQFTAENESVRAVLEAQTMQLKENLNQQGIRVEAVEVTIANQGFERNFAQNGEQSGKYEEPKKRGIRRIQLSGDMEIAEMELSEDERIAAEMMEMNGNTVDYMA